MGWKDAGDSVVNPDSTLVKGPRRHASFRVRLRRELRLATRPVLRRPPAGPLRKKPPSSAAASTSGSEDIGYYAYALEGDKKPVKTIASNAGHLLWAASPAGPGRARGAAPARTGHVERLGHPHPLCDEPGLQPVLVSKWLRVAA